MAKFLSTTGTNYHLEELIKGASDRLILISPFLKLNDRMKELLADKNRLKIDVRIVYGKSELQPQEIEWLRGLTYIRTSFCKNLHAKCYMNEEMCIITSLNLYEFSQVNNNEMGILIQRSEDGQLYKDAYEEAQRIIRISDEVRISLERVSSSTTLETPAAEPDKAGKTDVANMADRPDNRGGRSGASSGSNRRKALIFKNSRQAGPENRPIFRPCHRERLSGTGWRPACAHRQGREGRRGVCSQVPLRPLLSVAARLSSGLNSSSGPAKLTVTEPATWHKLQKPSSQQTA